MKNTKLAIIGSRGIPSKYGGFETFTDYISSELVKRGFDVFVSCEYSNIKDRTYDYNGVKLFYFPIKSPKSGFSKILYELIYDVYSLFWSSSRVDVIYMLGYSAAFFFFIPKLFGKKLWVNPDGLEWKRSKFSVIVKMLLKFCEKLMIFWTKDIIADSKAIKKYLDDKYKIKSHYISYGVSEPPMVKWDSKFIPDSLITNIYPEEYWLVVARLEPENNIHVIIEAYIASNSKKPLVIIGNFVSETYKSLIKELVNNKHDPKKIIFTGGIYEQERLNLIRQNCFSYIHGHSVGGTNPSLLEAMIMKNSIIAHDNDFNREVCGNVAIFFKDSKDLENKMDLLEDNPKEFIKLRTKAYMKVKEKYSWNLIINEYEVLLS